MHSMTTYDISLAEVEAARQRIQPYVRHTPLLPLPPAQTDLPPQLRLKLENLQVSGSFKARGAFNNLLQASPEQRQRGVIVASGGNHGLAIAYAAAKLGVPADVYLPTTASEDRARRIADQGAIVQRFGENPSDTLRHAYEQATHEGRLYVHPFDAEGTVHGTGTLGLELLDDLPELDCVLIAIGGGGLIGGMSAAIKQRRPQARIIGVEPVGAAAMRRSLDADQVIELPGVRTIADTLAPRSVSERTLWLAQRYVDEVVLVDDAQMLAAMRWLWTDANQLVEPAGAAVIAALLGGQVALEGFRQPVALICGGNAAAGSVFTAYEQASALLTAPVE
jgi:threonine dehydratase